MVRKKYGAEEARAHLPELLERAHQGGSTVITKRGKPYAVLVPVAQAQSTKRRLSLLALKGTGKGLWGREPARAVSNMRDEWE